MMTREERERRLLAKFAEVKAKFPNQDIGPYAFAVFCDGWVSGHALGCEETSEMMIQKTDEALGKAIAQLDEKLAESKP